MRIEGEVQNILFFNESNNYVVFQISYEKSIVTVSGYAPKLFIGEEVEIVGHFNDHKKYGEQFIIESCNKVLPTSTKGMVRYLSSGLIKGVGPTLAMNIVDRFGKDTFKIINNEPQRLLEVNKLGEKKLNTILESFEENKEIQSTLVYLHSYNIGHNLAMRIYNFYKGATQEIIEQNPYDMIDHIRGVGFKVADQIALSSGVQKESPLRLNAAIKFIFNSVINTHGHTIIKKYTILKQLEKIIEVNQSQFDHMIENMVMNNEIKHLDTLHLNDYYTLYSIFSLENKIYSTLNQIREQESNINYDFHHIQDSVTSQFPTISVDQKEAILSFLNHNLAIVTGGPGTGKTTLIKMFVMIAKIYNKSILLCAPTGRAAKRLSEATWNSAKTIHRMLEFNPQNGGFKHNQDNPLKQDIIIIDESSMIDIYLMNSLLNAILPTTKIVFVGDADQLPSIGPGNLLHDFISLFSENVTFLKKIFRQVSHSKIILNAHRVNQKISINFKSDEKDDFIFISDEQDPMASIKKICKEFTSENIQILSPMQKGTYGVKSLNKIMQDEWNPNIGQQKIINTEREFRLHDKVIQTTNNYDAKVFNGDIGKIVNITETIVAIQFDDVLVEYQHNELDQIQLAYAITIHKSQGSEYDYAVLFLMKEQYVMLNKNLIYTAITRAKKKVFVIGNISMINTSIKSKESKRLSILSKIDASNQEEFINSYT